MNECRIVSKGEIKTSEWTGGTTSELFIYPDNAVYAERNFEVRVSTATVELESSEFTSLPDYTRHIMPLAGGMKLCHEDHHEIELAPYQTDIFSGSWKTKSYGKCVDFNLMHTQDWSGLMRAITEDCVISCARDGITALYARRGGVTVTVSESKHVILTNILNTGDFLVIIGKAESERDTGAELTISGVSGGGESPAAVWVQADRENTDLA